MQGSEMKFGRARPWKGPCESQVTDDPAGEFFTVPGFPHGLSQMTPRFHHPLAVFLTSSGLSGG